MGQDGLGCNPVEIDKVAEVERFLAVYRAQLQQGDIQQAYKYLLQCVMQSKAHLSGKFSSEFSFGNISQGYMDFTYFPFFDDFLRERKLRFGVVLNHRDLCFELWLMGQNALVQKDYWEKLKNTEWNLHRTEMPRYSVLETVLIETPDFRNTDAIMNKIEPQVLSKAQVIITCLKTAEQNG